jgi:hypothetical protein
MCGCADENGGWLNKLNNLRLKKYYNLAGYKPTLETPL